MINTNQNTVTKDKQYFIKEVQYLLNSDEFEERDKANLALLAYDLGRSTTEENMNNSREEYYLRQSAFVWKNGMKEALRSRRKYR